MHRVGAQDEQLGPAGLEPGRGSREQHAGLVPPALGLQPLDLGEVDRVEQQPGGGEPADPVTHELVGEAVVLRTRLPAHAAEQADELHGVVPARSSAPSSASAWRGWMHRAPSACASATTWGSSRHRASPRRTQDVRRLASLGQVAHEAAQGRQACGSAARTGRRRAAPHDGAAPRAGRRRDPRRGRSRWGAPRARAGPSPRRRRCRRRAPRPGPRRRAVGARRPRTPCPRSRGGPSRGCPGGSAAASGRGPRGRSRPGGRRATRARH